MADHTTEILGSLSHKYESLQASYWDSIAAPDYTTPFVSKRLRSPSVATSPQQQPHSRYPRASPSTLDIRARVQKAGRTRSHSEAFQLDNRVHSYSTDWNTPTNNAHNDLSGRAFQRRRTMSAGAIATSTGEDRSRPILFSIPSFASSATIVNTSDSEDLDISWTNHSGIHSQPRSLGDEVPASLGDNGPMSGSRDIKGPIKHSASTSSSKEDCDAASGGLDHGTADSKVVAGKTSAVADGDEASRTSTMDVQRYSLPNASALDPMVSLHNGFSTTMTIPTARRADKMAPPSFAELGLVVVDTSVISPPPLHGSFKAYYARVPFAASTTESTVVVSPASHRLHEDIFAAAPQVPIITGSSDSTESDCSSPELSDGRKRKARRVRHPKRAKKLRLEDESDNSSFSTSPDVLMGEPHLALSDSGSDSSIKYEDAAQSRGEKRKWDSPFSPRDAKTSPSVALFEGDQSAFASWPAHVSEGPSKRAKSEPAAVDVSSPSQLAAKRMRRGSNDDSLIRPVNVSYVRRRTRSWDPQLKADERISVPTLLGHDDSSPCVVFSRPAAVTQAYNYLEEDADNIAQYGVSFDAFSSIAVGSHDTLMEDSLDEGEMDQVCSMLSLTPQVLPAFESPGPTFSSASSSATPTRQGSDATELEEDDTCKAATQRDEESDSRFNWTQDIIFPSLSDPPTLFGDMLLGADPVDMIEYSYDGTTEGSTLSTPPPTDHCLRLRMALAKSSAADPMLRVYREGDCDVASAVKAVAKNQLAPQYMLKGVLPWWKSLEERMGERDGECRRPKKPYRLQVSHAPLWISRQPTLSETEMEKEEDDDTVAGHQASSESFNWADSTEDDGLGDLPAFD